MKSKKPFLIIAVTLILAISLSGCVIIPLSKRYSFSVEEVSSVQFYDLRDPESEGHTGSDIPDEPVYTVPEGDKEDFLKAFSKLKFSDTIIIMLAAVDPSFSYGEWVVRINFSDGRYAFYSCGGYGETFNTEGELISSTHFSCDCNKLESLIGKYYEAETPST